MGSNCDLAALGSLRVPAEPRKEEKKSGEREENGRMDEMINNNCHTLTIWYRLDCVKDVSPLMRLEGVPMVFALRVSNDANESL